MYIWQGRRHWVDWDEHVQTAILRLVQIWVYGGRSATHEAYHFLIGLYQFQSAWPSADLLELPTILISPYSTQWGGQTPPYAHSYLIPHTAHPIFEYLAMSTFNFQLLLVLICPADSERMTRLGWNGWKMEVHVYRYQHRVRSSASRNGLPENAGPENAGTNSIFELSHTLKTRRWANTYIMLKQ